MDSELHYYVNFLVALQAGFPKSFAYLIAYSSQYTDDNIYEYDIGYCVNHHLYNTIHYHNIVTQIQLSLKNDAAIFEKVLPFFHFPPGSDADQKNLNTQRVDGCTHIMNTTAGGKHARTALRRALKTHNPYRIGIASHTFLDTWAHQNFTGTFDSFNCVNITANRPSLDSFIPRVGHVDCMTLPDVVGTIWQDYRIKCCVVDNNLRFMEAITELYKEYRYSMSDCRTRKKTKACYTCSTHKCRKMLFKHLGSIWNISSRTTRIKMYNKCCRDIYRCSIPNYHKQRWFNLAIQEIANIDARSVYVWRAKDPKRTQWYKFQEAAKAHYQCIANSLSRKKIIDIATV